MKRGSRELDGARGEDGGGSGDGIGHDGVDRNLSGLDGRGRGVIVAEREGCVGWLGTRFSATGEEGG